MHILGGHFLSELVGTALSQTIAVPQIGRQHAAGEYQGPARRRNWRPTGKTEVRRDGAIIRHYGFVDHSRYTGKILRAIRKQQCRGPEILRMIHETRR